MKSRRITGKHRSKCYMLNLKIFTMARYTWEMILYLGNDLISRISTITTINNQD